MFDVWSLFHFGGQPVKQDRLEVAKAYIEKHTALYRHYCIPEVQRHVKQFTCVELSHDEAVQIVQGIRNDLDMGPIAWYNLLTSQERKELEAKGQF